MKILYKAVICHCLLVFCGMMMTAGVAIASAALPDEAQQMQRKYDDAERALRDRRTEQKHAVARQYSEKLAGLREQFQKAGDLAGFQAVLGEQKRVTEEKGVPEASPAGASIRAIWSTCQESIQKADADYQRESSALALRYHAALEDLERRLTQQGNIAAATAVMQYRQDFIESLAPAEPATAEVPTVPGEPTRPSTPTRPSMEMRTGERPAPDMPTLPAAPVKPEAEKNEEGAYIAEKLLAFANEFIGQNIDVAGKIRRIERSGMDRNTLRIELEGGLFADISLQPFETRAKERKERLNVNARTMGDVGLYIGSERYLNPGSSITLRGVLRLRMNRHVLESASIRKISESSTSSLLGIWNHYR